MDKEPKHILLTKKAVARSQLETAIELWFHYGDPASIHLLAVASNDCLHALGTKKGKPTLMGDRMKLLPKKHGDKLRVAQNFFKHGSVQPDKVLRYDPRHAEVLLFDSVIAVSEIFGDASPAMRAFWTYFALSNPGSGANIDAIVRPEIREYIGWSEGSQIDRTEFLERFLGLSE